MIILGQDKPSISALTHHGVKGMKWGVRNKPTSADIHGARERHNQRITDLNRLFNKASVTESKARRVELLKKIHSIANEGLKSGDVSTAARMTRGEKVILAVTTGGLGNAAVALSNKGQRNVANAILKDFGQTKLSEFD
jgi:hypothetical protein